MGKLEGVPSAAEDRSQEEIEAGRLDLKGAQEEANLMRVYDSEDQKRHPRKYSEGIFSGIPLEVEPTAEDYDKALAAIEEMKELARKEPADVKMWYKIARGLHNFTSVQRIIFDLLVFGVVEEREGGEVFGSDRVKRISKAQGDSDSIIMEELTDAAKKLKDLKKSGKKFGEYLNLVDRNLREENEAD